MRVLNELSPARRRWVTSFWCLLVVAGLGLLFRPADASAQLSRVGNSQGVLSRAGSLVRGTDVAYDPVNDVYLLVGANGWIGGVFTDASGAVKAGTAQFYIGSARGGDNNIYASFPRVTYSPDVNNGQGGFLVSWVQNDGAPNHAHAQIVAYPNGPISADVQVSDDRNGGTWWEAGAPVAYSTTSRRFLVAWQQIGGWIQARMLDVNGALSGSIFTLKNGSARDPGVAWNAATDEFGVCYSAFDAGSYVALVRVAAATSEVSARNTWGYSVGTFITDITVNPTTRHYLVAWYGGNAGRYADVDENGVVQGTGALGVGSYDGLGVAFNATSGTMLAVGQGNSSEILGLETDGAGVPRMSAMVLTNGGGTSGSFHPRTTARRNSKQWNISYSRQLVAGASQIVETSSALGGPVSDIKMNLESPTNGAAYRTTDTITISGWVLDKGDTNGLGIDRVDVWAVPSGGGNATFIGAVTAFSARTDIAAQYGAQYTNSGFSATKTGLPAGTYAIEAYPRSTVNGSKYGSPKRATVTVSSTDMRMSLDGPANGSAQSPTFTVEGWALDKFASSGTGVQAVHVWAFGSGGAATFLGAATLGILRTDVGTAHGTQFNNAGFTLTATLPVGSYRVVAYVRDLTTGTFSLSQSANITIAATPNPAMSLDGPAAGTIVVNWQTTVYGWAIDRGASSGTGVDQVHVWAFPVGGGNAIFQGAAYGSARGDVADAYGSRFLNSGYSLALNNLASGQEYDVVVYARSTVTGTFNQNRVVRVRAQ